MNDAERDLVAPVLTVGQLRVALSRWPDEAEVLVLRGGRMAQAIGTDVINKQCGCLLGPIV